MGPTPTLPAALQRELSDIAYTHTGIQLGPEKCGLLAARVQKRLRALGLTDFQAYRAHFASDPGELQQFINAITTNTTSFWRESDHFTLAEAHVARIADAGVRRLRLWCAASSTGQEPYTLALSLLPLVRQRGLDLQILATDIDTSVLAKARQGLYPNTDGVPDDVVDWGFREEAGGWRICPEAREMVRFAQLNLTRPPFPMQGPLELIFARNVMIYHDVPTRQRLISECERLLSPGGLLFVGHSESANGLTHGLVAVRPSVYARPSGRR